MLVQSHFVDIPTPTGVMRIHVHRPSENNSNHSKKIPAVLFYSEIFQQTGPIARAACYLAGQGYAVVVPEVFHELNPIGTVLGYDDAGRQKGNADKATKDVQSYDTDNRATIDWLKTQAWFNGNLGAMGFCIGGHLAFRAALQPEVLATACFYATDLHNQTMPNKPNQHSMDRLADIKGELMMLWGKQDPYIPVNERLKLYQKFTEANLNFTWHEFNGQHAFMRDEDPRYDSELAAIGYQLAMQIFNRNL
jgi:carboxymethylenebutenolidase